MVAGRNAGDDGVMRPLGRAADAGGQAPVSGYLRALVDRDPAMMAQVLAPGAELRALIPPGLRQASGADQAASLVLGWFADASAVELRDSDAIVIGPRTRLRYRLRVTEGDDVYDVEQVAYFTLGADRILAADLLCSGFHQAAATENAAG